MTKEELIIRLVDLLDTIEDTDQDEFDDGEIEDLVCEANIPITRANQIYRTTYAPGPSGVEIKGEV